MKKRIGILTSGGDCPGLNAAIRGLAKSSYAMFDCEFVGIRNGYRGLIDGDYYEMIPSDFSGILTLGGTMLGSKRTPYRDMRTIDEDGIDKVANMVENYNRMRLDCLVTLGGNGTHKNANLLREEGLNVIALPKTIDNDIYGTEYTFGFHSAVDIATDVIDKIHTTASSHDRVMIIELMGNKAGWLTLYAGLAGGADIVLIPEVPYSLESIYEALLERQKHGKNFSIIVIAEGAKTIKEAQMKKRAFEKHRLEMQYHTVSYRLAEQINKKLGFDTRVTVPGHTQRGGTPSALDRILATNFGAFAAELIKDEEYGNTVSIVKNKIKSTPLEEMAHLRKQVTRDTDEFKTALHLGINFGE